LTELAARRNIAIVGISHLSKDEKKKVLMRVIGSLAFVAAARAAYLVTSDPDDKARRLFLPLKNNLGPDSTGLAFRIEGASIASGAGRIATSRVSWESAPVTMTADDAMTAGTPQRTSASDEAVNWLRETLADGPVAAAQVYEMATTDGITKRTLQRASGTSEVLKEKSGMTGGWVWSLLGKVAKTVEGSQTSDVATFGEVGDLRKTEGEMTEVEL
jgi:hypothetical protein